MSKKDLKLPKEEAKKYIEDFFKDIKNKNPKDIKRIKKISMKNKIPLKEKRKAFCKICLQPYTGKEKVRINKGKKSVTCNNCGYTTRWKIK